MILWITVGLSILTYLVGLRWMRLEWAVTMALMPSFSLYLLLAYEKTVVRWFPTMWVLLAALVTMCFMLLMKQKTKGPRPAAAIALLIVMGALVVQESFTDNIPSANAETITDEQTISNNIDTVLFLQEEQWSTLTTDQKLSVLRVIGSIEAYYFGLPKELKVRAVDLSGNTHASYNDMTHTISIDLGHMQDSGAEVLATFLHEVCHSYQHRLVEAYIAADEDTRKLRLYKAAAQYEQEFSNYIDPDHDLGSYLFQKCEMDAQAYAQDAVVDYYNRIHEYLQETSIE